MWVVNIRTVIVDDNEYQSERSLDIKYPASTGLRTCNGEWCWRDARPLAFALWDGLFGRPSASLATQKPPYFRGSTGAFVAWLRPVNYRCLTYSNPLGAFMSLKSVGSQTGSMRGPAGQRPSCTYKDEAMEFSQIQL